MRKIGDPARKAAPPKEIYRYRIVDPEGVIHVCEDDGDIHRIGPEFAAYIAELEAKFGMLGPDGLWTLSLMQRIEVRKADRSPKCEVRSAKGGTYGTI